MTYTKVNYHESDPVSDGLHFLREPLETDQLGVSVLDCDPGWTGMEHDHADENHEEVYLLIEGEATVRIEGEAVDMAEGDAVRVPAEATRQIENGDTESQFVLVGAP
jgi:mannose-6-phosphate isomerase-like protein (cupin superfamily)